MGEYDVPDPNRANDPNRATNPSRATNPNRVSERGGRAPADGSERVFGRETLEARSGPAFPGSEYLRRGTPRQVLAEIVEGDPLGMRGRCTERLCTRALLLSLDRLVLRSMARAARAAMTYRGRPQLARWLNAQIDAAIRDLIAEDRENERMGLLPGEPADPHYAFVSEALGVDPALARRVCVVHNDLPDLQRRVFWAVIVEGKSLHRCVAEGLGPHGRLREALADALRAVSRLRSVSRLDDHKQE